MNSNKLRAGELFPSIELPTLDNTMINIAKPNNGADWQLVVIYRGAHCPLCTRYLNELEALKGKFLDVGVSIVAVSADSKEQATNHLAGLSVSFPIAYGLSIEQMQQLGLYISNPRSPQETDHPFAEPGLYVINDEGRTQVIDVSNGPFVRPELGILLSGLAFIRNPENNYPIRGTF